MRVPASDTVRLAIRLELTRAGMTQQQLAGLLSEHDSWVSRRLTGITPLTVDDLDRIAYAMGLPVATFLVEHDQAS